VRSFLVAVTITLSNSLVASESTSWQYPIRDNPSKQQVP
jgi:hypothetical protein